MHIGDILTHRKDVTGLRVVGSHGLGAHIPQQCGSNVFVLLELCGGQGVLIDHVTRTNAVSKRHEMRCASPVGAAKEKLLKK